VIPNAGPGSSGWPRRIAAAIALCVGIAGCGGNAASELGPDSRAQDMAAESAGWNEAIAGWQHDLAAWHAVPANPASPAGALRAERVDEQSRRVAAFARALATHEARLRMVLAAGRHTPFALATTAAEDHRELQARFDMLAASELSLENENQGAVLPMAGNGGGEADGSP